MTTPETLTPREVAARQLRRQLPRVFNAGDLGLSGPADADDVVAIVLSALAEAGMVLTAFSRCSCRKTPLDYEGPERDCPVHGEPEVMLAEVTDERDNHADRIALAVEKASQRSEALYAARDRTPSDQRERRIRFEQVANELDEIRRILEPAASRSQVRRHGIQQGDDRA
jgi:hypothetical protein